MLQVLLSILAILITLSVVIGIHEYSHFIAARLLGVKVLRFSIGFGKILWRKYDKKGTEYVVSLLPLGGYVKMLDETEEPVPEHERKYAFNTQPFYKKFLIVFAGPFSNIVAAFFLYWLIFVIGFTTFIPVIGKVTNNSIAAEGGLKPKQEIVSVDDKPITNWVSIVMRLFMHVGDEDILTLTVKNPGSNKIESHKLNLANWHLDALKPDPLASLGISPYEPNIPLVISIISPDSPAAQSSLKIGDKILAINKTPITKWEELMEKISTNPGEEITITVQRNKKNLDVPVTIGTAHNLILQKYGYLGIAPQIELPKEMLREVKYSPLEAVPRAWQEIVDFVQFNFVSIAKLLEGKVSLQSLGGPITIFSSAGTALNYGIIPFLSFLAFLNIAIGVINFLPIPGLDGGHMLFQIIELILRRSISVRTQILFYRLGFIFLIFLIMQAIVNDLIRLW